METRIKAFLLLFLGFASVSFAEGPRYQHKESEKQLEFENAYKDLRKKVDKSVLTNNTSGQILVGQGSGVNPQWGNCLNTALCYDSSGNVTQPLQPSFLVTANDVTNVTGDGTVYTMVWNNEIYDQGGDFASNTFTAPVTGRYLLSVNVMFSAFVAGNTDGVLTIVTSNRNYRNYMNDVSALTDKSFVVVVIADMDAGDTATVTAAVNGTSKGVDIAGSVQYNFFSGSLIN